MFAGVSSPTTRNSFFARCRTLAALTAATLLTAASLAACSGGSTEGVTPTVNTPTPVVTTPSPTPSPTPTGEPFELEDIPTPREPEIPQEMLLRDQDGAQAFTRYALEELHWMFATHETNEWRAIHDATCDLCLLYAENLSTNKIKYTGMSAIFKGWEFHHESGIEDVWLIGVHFNLTKHQKWDLRTMTVETVPQSTEPESLYFIVSFDEVGWYIADLSPQRPVHYLGEES